MASHPTRRGYLRIATGLSRTRIADIACPRRVLVLIQSLLIPKSVQLSARVSLHTLPGIRNYPKITSSWTCKSMHVLGMSSYLTSGEQRNALDLLQAFPHVVSLPSNLQSLGTKEPLLKPVDSTLEISQKHEP
ncbi:hypothetical protein L2E82_30845 [Cichorium intybus]|uniref:Uncharacterized protein n=1 Tax=Cichorium intybus TaxID=13427 RepID=A0ACB9D1N7_CICIN|nr:hypothetical protein L2E82_30845 [Cichorium intybus]